MALAEAEREGSGASVWATRWWEGVAEGEPVWATVAMKVSDTVLVAVGGGAVVAPVPVPPPSACP